MTAAAPILPLADLETIRSAITEKFRSTRAFEQTADLPHMAVQGVMLGKASPHRLALVLDAVRAHLGIEVHSSIELPPPMPWRGRCTNASLSDTERVAIRETIRLRFGSIRTFERRAGLPANSIRALFLDRTSPDRLDLLRAALCDHLGIQVGASTTASHDPLHHLLARGKISMREADAGRALADVARGWRYPGRQPGPALVQAWPERLRDLWRALASADVETDARRPRLPTASLVAWNVVVEDEQPAILDIDLQQADWPLAMTAHMSLQIGLRSIADALEADIVSATTASAASEINQDDQAKATDYANRLKLAIEISPTMSSYQVEAATGISNGTIKALKRVMRIRPDMIPDIAQGTLTVNAAALIAGAVKPKRDRAA